MYLMKDGWKVKAVPDEEHYDDRPPGWVHPETRIGMDQITDV